MNYNTNIKTDVEVKYTVDLNEVELRGLSEMLSWSQDVVEKAFITITYEPQVKRMVAAHRSLQNRLRDDVNTALRRLDQARKLLREGMTDDNGS